MMLFRAGNSEVAVSVGGQNKHGYLDILWLSRFLEWSVAKCPSCNLNPVCLASQVLSVSKFSFNTHPPAIAVELFAFPSRGYKLFPEMYRHTIWHRGLI